MSVLRVATIAMLSMAFASPSFAQSQSQQKQQSKKNQEKQNQSQPVEASFENAEPRTFPVADQLAELTVATPETVFSGQKYQYMLRVKNVASSPLANVRIMQIDGEKMDVVSSKPKQDESSGLSWSFKKLNPNETQEVSVTAVAGSTGEHDHCFVVTYDEVVCSKVKVIDPAVEIVKTGPEQAVVCEPFEYVYELTNTGTGTAKDFIVRDELAENLKTQDGKSKLEFRVEQLAAGETKRFKTSVHSMKPGTYESRAVVEQARGESHNSETVATEVRAPELTVEIQGPRAFKSGEPGNYDIVVTNNADVPARDVSLDVTPGDQVEVVNAADGDARDGGKYYRYSVGQLDAGQSETVSISIDSPEGSSESASFTANARALCAMDQETEVANASTRVESRVIRLTSLLLSIVDTDDVIGTGETITYRVRVRNQGAYADEDVALTLEMPTGLEYQKSDGPSQAESNGQRVNFDPIDKIEPGQTLEWMVTANAKTAGEKLTRCELQSKELQNTVEAEEVSTIYDAATQKVGSE